MTTRQTPDAVREAVARIINPSAWPNEDQLAAYPDEDWDAAKNAAFATADAILAALDSRAGDAGEGCGAAFMKMEAAGERALVTYEDRAPGMWGRARAVWDAMEAERLAATPAPAVDAVPAGEVTKADRDLFALICPDMASLIYGGDLDDFQDMQAIVRHRTGDAALVQIDALTSLENAMRAKNLSWDFHEGYQQAINDVRKVMICTVETVQP